MTSELSWAVGLGLAAGLLSLIDPVPYVRDVLRGSTRPHRGTWCVWSVLGIVAFFSQWGGGGGWSLVMVGIQAVSMTMVFALSIRRGVGGLAGIDLTLIGVAIVGILGWQVSDEPLVAVVCVVVADLAGALMMLPKTWRDPGSETLSTFALAGASGVLAALAEGPAGLTLLLYPVYFGVINALTAGIIVARTRALRVLTPS